jgi:hypothetical protein
MECKRECKRNAKEECKMKCERARKCGIGDRILKLSGKQD